MENVTSLPANQGNDHPGEIDSKEASIRSRLQGILPQSILGRGKIGSYWLELLDLEISFGAVDSTYFDLAASLASSSIGKGKGRNDKYVINQWVSFNGLAINDPVGSEFMDRFEDRKKAFLGSFPAENSKTAKNLASRISVIQKYYVQCRLNDGMPSDFRKALIYAMARKGCVASDLLGIPGLSSSYVAFAWVTQGATPAPFEASNNIRIVENYLDLPPGTLARRIDSATKKPVADFSKDRAYGRYHGMVRRLPYALPVTAMPAPVVDLLNQYIEHKKKLDHKIGGKIVGLARTETLNSESTERHRLGQFERFFGALCLPKASGSEILWIDQIQRGHGCSPEDIKLTWLVDQEKLYAYMQFCLRRSYDVPHFAEVERQMAAVAQGKTPQRIGQFNKTMSESFLQFLRVVNGMVNKPHSFLRMHPEFGRELNPPVSAENWEAWCLERHSEILNLFEIAEQRTVEGQKRSNKDLLNEILRLPNPKEPFYQLLEAMERDLPPSTRPTFQAKHWRDMTIIAWLLFDPLRIKNLSLLDIGVHLTESKGQWSLYIPKHEFKNDIWGHAEDRRIDLPDDLAYYVKVWVEKYRPRCKHASHSDALFVPTQNQDKSHSHSKNGRQSKKSRNKEYRMAENEISLCVAKHTKHYLGLAVRPHAFRLLVATTAVRNGATPIHVKALLNDSEKIANEVYRDIKNVDSNEALISFHKAGRGKRLREDGAHP